MEKMKSMILTLLNIKSFSQEGGKPVLTTEQQEKIKATLGQEVLTQFNALLAKGDSEEGNETEDNAQMTAFINAVTAHSAAVSAAFQTKLEKVISEKGSLESVVKELQSTVKTLADSQEADPIPEMDSTIPRKADAPVVMKVNMTQNHYAAAGEFLKTGRNIMAANEDGDTIDVAQLKTEFGTYLNTQRNLEIFRQILTGFTTAQYMTTKMATTEWRATQALITSVVQQFSPKWTPSGKTKFKPLKIQNYRHKINYPITPADVLDSYLMYLYDEGLAPDQMPITDYITNVMVLPQVLQDIELRMIAKASYVEQDWSTVSENDPGTPPEDSMTGFETILIDAKAAVGGASDTGINFFSQSINWVTATNQEVLDFVNAFVDWINPQYQSQRQPVFCSLDVYKRYKRAYKAIWGANSGQDGDFGRDQIDYSNNILVPLDSMYSSPIIFATPKANFIKLRHKNEVPNIINDVQKFNYTVKLFGEFWLGTGFAIGEAVFAYVPAGYNAKRAITESWGEYTEYQEYNPNGSGGSGSASGGI